MNTYDTTMDNEVKYVEQFVIFTYMTNQIVTKRFNIRKKLFWRATTV